MRDLSVTDLIARVSDWQQELFRARCEKVVGQLKDTSKLKKLRHDIARASTLINEKRRSENADNA
ncbi:MAG: 50S ribosomal protein L29 [Deltaproteobacteria bacterium]|nr:50S ribosomal protein L29 [Deltaproteobacteria bacterium]